MMSAKEQFEVNVRSIGLVVTIVSIVGLIDWLANHGGQQLLESGTLFVIGLSLLADPSKLSGAVYPAQEASQDDGESASQP